jgi:N-acetylglucosamine kinase-like BadF-type ATPase
VASSIVVGLDVGGSTTELLACASTSSDTVHLTGPGANPMRSTVSAAATALADVVETALTRFPTGRLSALCAGIAGAGRLDDQDELTRLLRQHLGVGASCSIRIVHDAEIALEAAFQDESGVVVIAGTGSVVYARSRSGRTARVGGWGYLLGDEGSGFALGQQALCAVADAIDNGPDTILRPWIAERYDVTSRDDLIRRVYQDDWPLQDVAPLVLEATDAGDTVATTITEEQAGRLADQVKWLVDRCDDVTPRISLTGGLVQEGTYAHTLRDALRARLPAWRVETAQHRPVQGALHMARRIAA